MVLLGAMAGFAAADSITASTVAAVLLGPAPPPCTPPLARCHRQRRPRRSHARAVGVYRLWRDGGFAIGVILAGVVADLAGIRAAV